MKKVTIVYFSHTGVTEQLALSILEGLKTESRIETSTHRIDGQEIVEGRFKNQALLDSLSQSDAIVFGSPTYMGNTSSQFKAFADATSELWTTQSLAGKLAAGFTCGSAPNGDQSNTLTYMTTLASQHGMLWLGLDSASGYNDKGVNRLGCQLGVVAHSPDGKLDDADAATAFYLGQRIATQLTRFN